VEPVWEDPLFQTIVQTPIMEITTMVQTMAEDFIYSSSNFKTKMGASK